MSTRANIANPCETRKSVLPIPPHNARHIARNPRIRRFMPDQAARILSSHPHVIIDDETATRSRALALVLTDYGDDLIIGHVIIMVRAPTRRLWLNPSAQKGGRARFTYLFSVIGGEDNIRAEMIEVQRELAQAQCKEKEFCNVRRRARREHRRITKAAVNVGGAS